MSTHVPGQVTYAVERYYVDAYGRRRCRAPLEDLVLNEDHCPCFRSMLLGRMNGIHFDTAPYTTLLILLHGLLHAPAMIQHKKGE